MAMGPATFQTSPGSTVRPKVKKNNAANVSRSGNTSLRTRGATVVSASTSPAMNAPMASDTCTSSAIPAISTARPTKHTVSSSSCSAPITRPTTDAPYRAMSATITRNPNALANEKMASPTLADSSSTGCRAARYTARNRSSTTTMPRIRRVSRLVSRCISTRILVTIADDEMPTAPASTSASGVPHPSAKPNASPAPMLSPR